MAKVFDDIRRTNRNPSPYSAEPFDYLNKSARPEMGCVRKLIEALFQRYPDVHKRELRARLRGGKFEAAFFELFLHEMFLRSGSEVEVHPKLSTPIARTPDLRVTIKSGMTIYVEATLDTGQSDQAAGTQALGNNLIDFVNQNLNSPDFWLSVQTLRLGNTMPRLRNCVSEISEWLAGLNWDDLRRASRGDSKFKVPKKLLRDRGWTLDIMAIPKPLGLRGRLGIRPILMHTGRAHPVETARRIRKVVSTKATRYGKLDAPYLVAINFLAEHPAPEDVVDGLFGAPKAFEPGRRPATASRLEREGNGALGPEKNTRVSGLIVTGRLVPATLATATARVYSNPWARYSRPSALLRLPEVIFDPDTGSFAIKHELTPREILGLSASWPREEQARENA